MSEPRHHEGPPSAGAAPMRPAAPPRHALGSRPRALEGVLRFVAAALAVVLVSGLAVAGAVAASLNSRLQGTVVSIGDSAQPLPEIGKIEGGFNILIVGSDTRVDQGGLGGSAEDVEGRRNDVTILLHVAQDQRSAVVVSFPRDLEVELPECARDFGYWNKINTALEIEGLPCVVETVEDLTGLPIHFAGLITFAGVVEMTNIIGGVDVCITAPIIDERAGIALPEPGVVNLRGADALGFLRTRYGVGDGSDLGRISAQQVFLSSMVRKLQSDGTLGDLRTVFSLADAALRNMTLSEGLADPYTLVSIALALKDIPPERITFVRWPTFDLGNGNLGTIGPLADELLGYIAADEPFRLADIGDDLASTPDPNAPPEPTPTASPEGGTPVIEGVPGQTAAQHSCAVGN